MRIVDDATWARLGWHARRDYLARLDGYRAHLEGEVQRARAEARKRALSEILEGEQRAHLLEASEILATLEPNPDGPRRLAEADRESALWEQRRRCAGQAARRARERRAAA